MKKVCFGILTVECNTETMRNRLSKSEKWYNNAAGRRGALHLSFKYQKSEPQIHFTNVQHNLNQNFIHWYTLNEIKPPPTLIQITIIRKSGIQKLLFPHPRYILNSKDFFGRKSNNTGTFSYSWKKQPLFGVLVKQCRHFNSSPEQ